jgi:NADPH2:quinone reductase
MKAIVVKEFGGPEVMKLEEVPTPRPGAGQVLVSIKAAGVNPVDALIRSGNYGERPRPYTPGFDAAGVVEAIGSGVKQIQSGDRVYLDGSVTGTYATHALCEQSQIHPLPTTLTFAQGAGVSVPYLTAARALFQKAMATAGEWLLVHGGSGGVGTAAIQMAKVEGLTVIATAGSDKGLELVRREGAHYALNHKDPDYLKKIADLTQGRGVDLILEMLANVNLGKDLTALAKNGRVVVIGSRGPVEINPRDAMTRDAVVLAMTLFNTPPADRADLHGRLTRGLMDGTLKPVIGKEFPLAEAAKAHEAVMSPGAFGKIVLIP